LMGRGKETAEEFSQLVKLLHQVGCTDKAEYLLRRNLEVGKESESLYRELFGTEKDEEYSAAIAAFADQFSVELELRENREFLDNDYRTEPRLTRFDEFRLLNEPCDVRFDYSNKDAVEADVSSMESDEYLILRWVNRVWEISGPNRG